MLEIPCHNMVVAWDGIRKATKDLRNVLRDEVRDDECWLTDLISININNLRDKILSEEVSFFPDDVEKLFKNDDGN